MKGFVAVLTAACLCVLLLGSFVGAQEYIDPDERFELELSEEYTLLDRSNLKQNAEFISRLGSSVENFGKAMTEGSIYLYAATEDNARQVQVKVWTGDTSERIVDLSALDDGGLQTARTEIGNTLVSAGDTLLETEQTERDGQIFFRYRVRAATDLESSDNESIGYCFDEYLTVVDGCFVALVFYNSSSEFSAAESAESKAIFDAFKVNQTVVRDSTRSLALSIFSIVMLILGAGVAAYVLWTFVRDLCDRRERPETLTDRIKTRRK